VSLLTAATIRTIPADAKNDGLYCYTFTDPNEGNREFKECSFDRNECRERQEASTNTVVNKCERGKVAKTGPNHVYCGVTDSRECWDKSKECEEFADNCHRVDNNSFDQNGIACPHICHSEKGEKFAEKNDRKEAKQNDEPVEELAVEEAKPNDDNDSVDEQDTDDGIVPPEVEEEEPIEEVEKEIEEGHDEESSEANSGD
jgi:hypothetical protein